VRWRSDRADEEARACYIAPAVNIEPRHPLLPPPGMTEDEWDALRDAQADADIAAGRGVPHEKVREWARKLGTPEEIPMPREWRG
jgi:hypothetical protein